MALSLERAWLYEVTRSRRLDPKDKPFGPITLSHREIETLLRAYHAEVDPATKMRWLRCLLRGLGYVCPEPPPEAGDAARGLLGGEG